MLFIIAGDENEARRYAHDNDLPRYEWQYVACAAVMQGYPPGCPLVRTGAWKTRDDLHVLNIMAQARGCIE